MTRRLPPAWKIRRELVRALKKLVFLPVVSVQKYLLPPYYDHFLRGKIKVHQGSIPEGKKAAIYLIFPKSGLLESHVIAIENILACGYSPIVVSNLPLSKNDINRLLSLTSIIMERPNFGYDFGGYRDAILEIGDRISSFEYLAIFNDSAWFPLRPEQRWLLDAEALKKDFVGAVSGGGVAPVNARDFNEVVWQEDTTRRPFHYCSFALLVRRDILKDPKFLSFWRKYHLSSDKMNTVRWGEMGLSRWVREHQYTHGATCDTTRLDDELRRLTDEEIAITFKKLITMGSDEYEKSLQENRMLLTDVQLNRNKIENFILAVCARIDTCYSLSYYNMIKKDHPFLKKSPLTTSKRFAEIILAVAEEISGPYGDIVRTEAKELALHLKRN